jgi:uncharacterized protein (DUF983 family)
MDSPPMTTVPSRSALQPVLRGLRGRCPNCGEGRLFGAFLKVNDHCAACGEALYHHRADDFPAYVVILLVGHLVVPLVLAVEMAFAPPLWVHAMLWLPLILGLTIGLLQPVKGAIIGFQWAAGMHGFEDGKKQRDGLVPALAPITFPSSTPGA